MSRYFLDVHQIIGQPESAAKGPVFDFTVKKPVARRTSPLGSADYGQLSVANLEVYALLGNSGQVQQKQETLGSLREIHVWSSEGFF